MKNIVKIFSILLFLSSLNFAQLAQITAPNMHSEVPIYKNRKGIQYSNMIVIKYKTKLIDLPRGVKLFDKSNIVNSQFTELALRLKNSYGEFSMSKIAPNAIWQDTLRTNKRTKQIVRVPDLSQIYKLEFEKPVPTDTLCEIIKSYSNIESANGPIISYLALIPNDPYYSGDYLWSFNAIKAEQAWSITTGSSSTYIAINDFFDGVNTLHEDLVGKVVYDNLNGNYGEHGIVTAGVAGAKTNNNLDIASLGWNCSLILDKNWGSYYAVASILDLVDNRGADVINFSWVTNYDNSDLKAVIEYALSCGVVCVASAGNNESPVPGKRYPAAYNFGSGGQVIAVSGTKLNNGIEEFFDDFNYSPGTDPINDPENAFIDFAAPGANYRGLSKTSSTGTIHIWSGTSISAPFVSALVGLMLSQNSSLTPNQIYDILKRTSEKIGQYSYNSNGWNRYLGYGRIDAEDAVNVAAGAPARVRNLHFTYASSEHPILAWEANTESNLSGYRIYREYDNSGTWTLAGSVNNSTTTFIDTIVSFTKPIWAKNVRYKVRAINSSSQYSVYSSVVNTTGFMIEQKISSANSAGNINFINNKNDYLLEQNYPNPFNPSTTISFSLPKKGYATLKIYDILGTEIITLAEGQYSGGIHQFNFDGSNLSSGLYVYQLSTEQGIISRKMILVK